MMVMPLTSPTRVKRRLTPENPETALRIVSSGMPISTAIATGSSPVPFVLGVMAGAGSNFLTPFGYQTNLMVYGPGRYRFLDFPRLGLPILVIVVASATLMIPLVFPFH